MTNVKFTENPLAFAKVMLAAVVSKIKRYFKKEWKPDYESIQRSRMFDALKYWTPELIDWIAKTEDPMKLAVASCLVNCHEWPAWLPSKPEWHDDMHKQREDETYNAKLYFCVEVHQMLQDKSQSISPGLHNKIWLTNNFRNYGS